MNRQSRQGPGTGCALLMLCVALLVTIGRSAATTPIYKCLDKNLGIVYTDEPCRDGELMDIRAGDADPAAVARLERARDALDRSAERRIAAQSRAGEQLNLAAAYGIGDAQNAYDFAAPPYAPWDYGAIAWFAGVGRHHPVRARPTKMEPRKFAPTPPHVAPRR